MYCVHDELFELIRKIGFLHVHRLILGELVKIGSIDIIPHQALDREVDSIFQIKAAGLNVLNVVDSWIDENTLNQLVDQGPWDMILWPFQTLREIEVISPRHALPASRKLPPEWITQLKKLNPRYVVPSSCQFIHESWSWYNQALFPISYKNFERELNQALPDTIVQKINPSVSFELDHNSLKYSDPLTWVLPQGDQNLDYEYNFELDPPTISEISQRFAKIDLDSSEKVYKYCREGLLQKYRSLDEGEDPFFQQSRNWKLSVFDDLGERKDFYYLIGKNQIETRSYHEEKITWLTEISLAKFYAALVFGESLTSMYIRIDAPKDAEIIEDPLIRCLFNTEVGSYQKAQLKRLGF